MLVSMGTDASGTPRGAPPPPSALGAGTTSLGARPARRISNRPPPPKSLFQTSHLPSNQPPRASSSQAKPNPSAASPLATRPANASEVRDELVRAVMPELRVLIEQLVKTAIEGSTASLLGRQHELESKVQRMAAASPGEPRELEAAVQRAVAPLLEKQRELEAELRDLRRGALPRGGSPNVGVQQAREVAMPPNLVPAPRPALVVPRAVPPRAIVAAYDTEPLLDIPAALNGSRRKRVVVWLLALGVILVLASVAGLAALSHSGKYL